MISFAILVCLFALSADAQISGSISARRPTYVSSIMPRANTNWGDWGVDDLCPSGQYAYGFSLKVEPGQGSSRDDTAVNGIKLHCGTLSATTNHDITSSVQQWGTWKRSQYCPRGQFLTSVSMRSEPGQGSSGDDTAVNDFTFYCGSRNVIRGHQMQGDGMPWGTWSGTVYCPANSFICGLKTQVEASQGSGDDTALNGAFFHCCR